MRGAFNLIVWINMKKAEKGTSIGEAAMKLQGASKSDR